MMKAKRVELFSVGGGILGAIGFRSELTDGTFWVFSGKAVPAIGFSAAGGGDKLNLELRWPDRDGATLSGDCGFSAFSVDVVSGFSGIVMFDRNGTVGTLHGLSFGAGMTIIPAGWGKFRQAKSFDD